VCRTPDLALIAEAKISIIRGNALIANIGIYLKTKMQTTGNNNKKRGKVMDENKNPQVEEEENTNEVKSEDLEDVAGGLLVPPPYKPRESFL